MSAKVVFLRRTPKEIEIFGGEVFVDIDGKNIGILGLEDLEIPLNDGVHKIKMYKSHTYGTFIGAAEMEINITNNNDLLIKYSPPMVVNQPGTIVVSDYQSKEVTNDIALSRENTILTDFKKDEQLKKDIEDKNKQGVNIYILLMVIFAILSCIEIMWIYSY